MAEATTPKRAIIGAGSRPALPRHIKLRHDAGRGRWVILGPESVFNPDDTAVSVLQKCDGERQVSQIVELLAAEYNAPAAEISADVIAMLQDLADKGVVKA